MQGIARIFQETLQFFAALARPVVGSLSDNRGLVALSVVLAFGLWIFVTDSENPTRTRVLPIDISVQPINVPDDVAMQITGHKTTDVYRRYGIAGHEDRKRAAEKLAEHLSSPQTGHTGTGKAKFPLKVMK